MPPPMMAGTPQNTKIPNFLLMLMSLSSEFRLTAEKDL
jgi:hypothetical protein